MLLPLRSQVEPGLVVKIQQGRVKEFNGELHITSTAKVTTLCPADTAVQVEEVKICGHLHQQ